MPKITTYRLKYDINKDLPIVTLRYRVIVPGQLGSGPKATEHTSEPFSPQGAHAIFVADMLRYEKPVHFVFGDSSHGPFITTGAEEVGEEEF